MPRQVRKQRTPQKRENAEEPEQETKGSDEKAAHELTDEVLADIDAALEGLDQNLAREYLQKGGQ